MARVLITLPEQAASGAIIEIRTLIMHIMETGYRPDSSGVVAPRDTLRRFTCRVDDEVAFTAELSPAIAANPYLVFTVRLGNSGALSFTWEGDNGFTQTERRQLRIIA